MPKEIIIAGAGFGGLILAEKLVKTTDAHVTLVAPNVTVQETAMKNRISTPLVRGSTVVQFGLDVGDTPQINAVQCGLIERGPIRSRIVGKIQSLFDQKFERNSLYSIDADVTRARLLDRVTDLVQTTDALTLHQGTAHGLIVADRRIRGVLTGAKELLMGDLVVDATGRPARLANNLASSQIKEVKHHQESRIVAGYISLPIEKMEDRFPGIGSNVFLDILPGNLIAIMTPVEKLVNSDATHLMLLEGNPKRIEQARADAKKITSNNEDRQLLAIQYLTEGTPWHDVLTQAQTLDRVVNFYHKDNISRTPLIPGIVFIGDAQLVVNPFNGSGVSYATKDSHLLAQNIVEYGAENGSQHYIGDMQEIIVKRMHGAKKLARGFKILERVL